MNLDVAAAFKKEVLSKQWPSSTLENMGDSGEPL